MKIMGFSDWVNLREVQMPPRNPAMARPSPVAAEIKKVIANNITKPRQARTAALMTLAKKKQADIKATPKDIQDIADAMPNQGVGPQAPR